MSETESIIKCQWCGKTTPHLVSGSGTHTTCENCDSKKKQLFWKVI